MTPTATKSEATTAATIHQPPPSKSARKVFHTSHWARSRQHHFGNPKLCRSVRDIHPQMAARLLYRPDSSCTCTGSSRSSCFPRPSGGSSITRLQTLRAPRRSSGSASRFIAPWVGASRPILGSIGRSSSIRCPRPAIVESLWPDLETDFTAGMVPLNRMGKAVHCAASSGTASPIRSSMAYVVDLDDFVLKQVVADGCHRRGRPVSRSRIPTRDPTAARARCGCHCLCCGSRHRQFRRFRSYHRPGRSHSWRGRTDIRRECRPRCRTTVERCRVVDPSRNVDLMVSTDRERDHVFRRGAVRPPCGRSPRIVEIRERHRCLSFSSTT